MTSLANPLSDLHPAQRNAISIKLAIALGLTALADWLFYGWRIGLSVVIFAVALIGGSLLANLGKLNQRRVLTASIVLIAGLAPAFEEINAISFVFAIIAMVVAACLLTNPDFRRPRDALGALRDLLLIGPFRLTGDVVSSVKVETLTTGFARWFVPLTLGSIFVVLFATANPLIERWIGLLNPGNAASKVDLPRALFWLAAVSLVWPFVRVRWRARQVKAAVAIPRPLPQAEARSAFPDIFGAEAVLLSLLLFNLLFAVQTVLDVVYLWGDARLPADITYADYAHRGAHALILTALLAAAFVLVAMRPGGPSERSNIIRPLVYIWVAQNVMLVASSILRLQRYVEVYLLTYMRIAAFVWMLLVMVGLVLIVARIVLERSNEWLIHVNLVSLAGTLYICSLINFTAIIADYNVEHSKEAGGKGVNLDSCYLVRLGPQAIAAIDRAIQIRGNDPGLVSRRDGLVEMQQQDMANWRSWGFRSFRLQRYLDQRAKPSSAG
jgi:uncharacterized protein DUF4153